MLLPSFLLLLFLHPLLFSCDLVGAAVVAINIVGWVILVVIMVNVVLVGGTCGRIGGDCSGDGGSTRR